MNRAYIIQACIDKISAKHYLEIGVQQGKNFFKIKADKKTAVDPNFLIGLKRKLSNLHSWLSSDFNEMTSTDFFKNKATLKLSNNKIDIAFIDGLHTYEQTLEDFLNCSQYLSSNGIIFFHDCNPTSAEAAAPLNSPKEKMRKFPGQNPEWNGDVWKTILHIRSLIPEWQAFVLDCDYGVGVAVRKKNPEPLNFSQTAIKAMDYSDLQKNRESFLGLKPESYLREFLDSL
jgi:hypothetical protein